MQTVSSRTVGSGAVYDGAPGTRDWQEPCRLVRPFVSRPWLADYMFGLKGRWAEEPAVAEVVLLPAADSPPAAALLYQLRPRKLSWPPPHQKCSWGPRSIQLHAGKQLTKRNQAYPQEVWCGRLVFLLCFYVFNVILLTENSSWNWKNCRTSSKYFFKISWIFFLNKRGGALEYFLKLKKVLLQEH